MLVTPTHAEFWEAKRPAPKWVRGLRKKYPCRTSQINIEACINAHAGIKPSKGETAATTLCYLCKSVMKRGEDVVAFLQKLVMFPETTMNPGRRSGYSRKWMWRILKNR